MIFRRETPGNALTLTKLNCPICKFILNLTLIPLSVFSSPPSSLVSSSCHFSPFYSSRVAASPLLTKHLSMDQSQFDLVTFGSRRVRSRTKQSSVSCDSDTSSKPRTKQSSISYESDMSSKRSSRLDMEDREMARAIKRIEKLSAEIRANEDVEGNARLLRERIDTARRMAAVTVAQMNEKMDAIEQAWDDRIIEEQKQIAKEVLSILKDLKEDDLAKALTWKNGRCSSRSGKSSSRSSSGSRRHSSSSRGSKSQSSGFSKKIAHLDKKEREFAGRSVEVRKDARQIDEMSRNLDSMNELERVVCNKLTRMESVGDAKPDSAVYGTVELVDNYRNTVQHLAKAIRSLSSVACLPAITNDDPLTKTEIDKLCGAMTEFMGRIKAQLGASGSSAELVTSPRPQTGVRVAGRSTARASTSESDNSVGNGRIGLPQTAAAPSGSASSVAASTALSIESHSG